MKTAETAPPAQTPGNEPHDTKPNTVPWSGWSGVFYAIIVYFAAQFIGSIVILTYPHLQHWDKVTTTAWIGSSILAQFWYVLLAEAISLAAIVWFIRRRKGSLRSIGLRRPHLNDIGYALLGFFIYFLAYIVLYYIVGKLVPSINLAQKQDTGFQDATGTMGLVLTFISLVVLPPFVEEVVFRGFVFSGLRNKLPLLGAAIGTSLLFASAHLQFGNGKPLLWVAAMDTFTLSMVLCYLRQKTGGLWAGMMVHGLKNGLAFVTLFLLVR